MEPRSSRPTIAIAEMPSSGECEEVMSGKGSGRRPAQVDDHVLSNNWAGSLGGKPFEVVRIVGDIPVWCNGIEHEATKDKPEHPLDRTICDCDR